MTTCNAIDNQKLFKKYLEVCNQALDANKERFPFKQILGAAQNCENPRTVEVSIVDDRPAANLMIMIDSNSIQSQSHDECENCQCDGKWRVSKTYLEAVVRNPDKYIKNPAKIDWDWMYDNT